LHAGSCNGVFERLSVMCQDHSAIAASLELVINQRLVRGLCASCGGGGCAACAGTGYRGRLPLVESFRVASELRPAIAKVDFSAIKPRPSLFDHAHRLVEQSRTNQAEIERVLGTGHDGGRL
jgi:general secretion pathway protein E